MTALDTIPNRVARRRLLGHIAADVDDGGANIVALTAPAGSGKTATLEQWLDQRRAAGDVVLTVSPEVDARGDLWPILVAEIRSAAPPSDISVVTEAVRQSLYAGTALAAPASHRPDHSGPPIWIMVDDVHQWSAPRTLGQLGRLLATARPTMRVAIGARYTPPGLLSTLLLQGAAKEYRFADLAFDEDEARELLAVADIILSDSDLGTLLRRTEGWAAGLRLAALAMARECDRPAFVRNFAGTERTIGDYLVSEVLSRLPPEHIDVLLDVSGTERVNLDLARLMSGRPDAGRILEELVATNSLVRTAHHAPDWYELHPLLRSYLRAESSRRDSARHRRRQAIATDWLERTGDTRGAIRLAVASADWQRVQALITASCTHIVMTDGPDAMRDVLRRLPTWLQSHPAVAGAAALTAVLDVDLAAADLDLAVLDAAGDDAARQLALRAVASLAAVRSRPMSGDDVTDAIAALDLVAGDDPDLTVLGRSLAAMALAMVGDLDAAGEAARAVAQIARRRGLDYLLFQALSALCAVSAFGTDFATVRSCATEAIAVATRRGWDRHPRLAQFYQNLAAAEWQRGEDAAAADHARAALEVADPDRDPLSAHAAVCIYDLTVVAPEAGLDLTSVGHLHAFNEFWHLLPPTTVAIDACFELMVSLRAHELGLAGAIIRRAEEVIPSAPDVYVFKAMKHVYQGREVTARQDLDHLLGDGLHCLTPWTSAIGWALVAHLADAAGEPARAHDALLHALRLAEPGHLIRGLADAAPSMERLLVRHQGRFGRYEGFVTDVLRFADNRPDGVVGNGLVLTDKEIAILQDLPSMLSLREIAEAHVVSINTVKSHLKSVYRKLGVASRREAVTQAHERGLI